MTDTTFRLTSAQRARGARPYPLNPLDGNPQSVSDIDKPPTVDCGGGCAFGTMRDYIRFGQMLLNGGGLDAFADPQQRQLVVAYGTAAPGQLRKYYREQVQDLVCGPMTR